MSAELTEALLEMHFYHPLFTLFQQHFGMRVMRILKPSQRDEAFLGFDIGWVQHRPNASRAAVQTTVREFIHGGVRPASFFLGYFLQFKVVTELNRRSRAMPRGFSTPYLRSELSMSPNVHTGISQHETLLRLAQLPRTDVSYACPMLLCEDDLHRAPDINDLRLVPLTSAPPGYASNERHYIAFQNRTAEPVWCSEPVQGSSISPTTWVESLRKMAADDVEPWLSELRRMLSSSDNELVRKKFRLPHALTIVALTDQ